MTTAETAAPSLCDDCTAPGRCCRSFGITLWAGTAEDAAEIFADRGYPFAVVAYDGPYTDEESRRDYGRVTCECPHVVEGRCAIYDHRPQVCRNFEPTSDRLCVFHRSWWFADAEATP